MRVRRATRFYINLQLKLGVFTTGFVGLSYARIQGAEAREQ